MPNDYDAPFARWLSKVTRLDARVAADGESVAPGKVYIPRGEHDLVLYANGMLKNALPARKGPVPSVDCLLESAAGLDGFALFGVVLTGMGRDGSAWPEVDAPRRSGYADARCRVVALYQHARCRDGERRRATLALAPPHIAQQLLAWVDPGADMTWRRHAR